MKPLKPEKYVDGMQVDESDRLSAHDILAQHVTNVSPVTAKAIALAVEEYEKMAALVHAPKQDLLEALSSVADLNHAIELLEAFARAATMAAGRLRQISVVAPLSAESFRPPSNPPRKSSRPPSSKQSNPPPSETASNGT